MIVRLQRVSGVGNAHVFSLRIALKDTTVMVSWVTASASLVEQVAKSAMKTTTAALESAKELIGSFRAVLLAIACVLKMVVYAL
jgi:hypothetical protein